jgi:NADH-quinone oxidoreductase subunit N
MNLALLAPELILTAAALGLLMGEAFWPAVRRPWLGVAAAAVAAAGLAAAGLSGVNAEAFGMFRVDGMAVFFKLILLAGLLIVLLLSAGYREFDGLKSWGTYGALLLLAGVGMLMLVSASDLLLVVISIELLGVASFILTGFFKDQRRSSEAAVKFFLVGAFSSGLMIYGVSLLYGLLGTTSLAAFAAAAGGEAHRLPLAGASILLLAGFGFKVAMVPFHMWVPDAYEGAPTPVTAFLSVAPKAAAFGALARVLPHHGELGLTGLLAVLAAVTMTVGNLSALPQRNVKRLLGYSSIAQMGYVLVGFTAAGTLGLRSVLLYAAAYLFMNLGAFACVIAVSNQSQTEDLDGFAGLAGRSLPLALATTVFMISLTGIPPMIGFVGKFAVFAAAVSEKYYWLAAVGLVNSVISLYYYFGIVRRMFFSEPASAAQARPIPQVLAGSVAATLIITLGAGLFPNALAAWVQRILP